MDDDTITIAKILSSEHDPTKTHNHCTVWPFKFLQPSDVQLVFCVCHQIMIFLLL